MKNAPSNDRQSFLGHSASTSRPTRIKYSLRNPLSRTFGTVGSTDMISNQLKDMANVQPTNFQEPHTSGRSIDRLPIEILQTIFCICLIGPLKDRQLNLWTISGTCRSWKGIVSNSPQLWTTLSSEFSLDFIYTCIERSRDLPLTVHIEREGILPVIDTMVLGCVKRMRRLSYHGPDVYLLGPLMPNLVEWTGTNEGDLRSHIFF